MPVTFAVAALAAYAVGQGPARLDLYRGAELPAGGVRYWSAEDTVLDSAVPDGNFGGSSYLTCGPGKNLLIRFGDLRRALGPNKRITKAALVFSITGGDPSPLGRASELNVPWGEGPAQVVGYGATPPDVTAPIWSASWRFRRSGEGAIAWQQPGASGVGDSKLYAAARSKAPDNDHVRIEGLEAAVQRQYDRPYQNFGFAFSFDGRVEFASSQSRTGKPRLELEYESMPPQKGPDLAVIRIVRTPEYPRYNAPKETHKAAQDGIEVEIPGEPANLKEKHGPDDREEVVYSAVIKNLGDAPATGFSVRWIQRERAGGAVESDRTLEPGAEATVPFRTGFRNLHTDHRLQPLGLVLEPKGPDAEPSNNGLTIYENALSVGLRVPAALAQTIARTNPLGARNVEEWAQAVVALWNDVIFPQSRFSFAPDGALERLRLQKVEIGEDAPSEFVEGFDPNQDISIGVRADVALSDPAVLRRLLKRMGAQLGLADLSSMNLGPKPGSITVGGASVDRYCADLYPGLMGGGDTRFDGYIPSALIPPYEPTFSPIFDALPMEATDLLSMTDTAALNAVLGRRRGFAPEGLFRQPSTVLLRIVDTGGLPVSNASVEFYQMVQGQIQGREPIAKAVTSAVGNTSLPSRPSLLPDSFKTFLEKPPAASPFGRVDPTGANGVMLLKVGGGGNSGYAYIKAWQLADAFRRSQSPVLVFEVRVNAGGDVDVAQNLAKNRIVSDSLNSLPVKLAGLVDESNANMIEFAGGKDAWIEIDLGRDRAFGEVRLAFGRPFWEKFNVLAYATGQTASEAKVVAKEVAWSWTSANRSDPVPDSTARSVAYRSAGLRARYIRIVRTEAGPPGFLTEIKIHPLRSP